MGHRHYFDKHSHGNGTTVGIGLAGIAAGAALAYFLYGTETGSEKREHIKDWAREKKDKVMRSAGALGGVGKEIYRDLSSILHDRYDELKELSAEEIEDVSAQVRNVWSGAKKDIEKILDEYDVGDES